ncbi:MAG: peptidoglycan-binding domain-containing protein, partial [Lysobacterales bacterium]
MRYELNIESEPFETDSGFDEASETLETELADWEWEEEASQRRRPRPAVPRGRAKSRIVSAKRLIKRPLRLPIRSPRPPIRPPRPVIFPTFPLPPFSVVEPRPPQPPAPAGAEPKGAAPAPAGEPPTLSAEPSEPSAEGSEHVRWVQDSLNRILGLRLPLDGIMGPEVRSAVRSFQERQGLPITGLVGPDTERALMAATSGQSPGASAAKPAAPGMSEPAEPAATPPRMTQSASTATDAEFDFEWEVPGAATTCLKGLI